VLVETLLFAAGLALYVKSTDALDRIGQVSLWVLAAFLLVVYAITVVGPPPPSKAAVPLAGFAMWLLVAWAYWIDRHRQPVAL
jgi:hypothetical protein